MRTASTKRWLPRSRSAIARTPDEFFARQWLLHHQRARANQMMASNGRCRQGSMVAAALFLIPVYVAPLWNLTMFAPQLRTAAWSLNRCAISGKCRTPPKLHEAVTLSGGC